MSLFNKTVSRLRWAFTSAARKHALEQEAYTLIAFDPRVGELLAQARKDGVKIMFEPRLGGSKTGGDYSVSDKTIRINPYPHGEMVTSSAMAETLAHELRHHWQHKESNINCDSGGHSLTNVPRLSFIYNRVAEADAYAFQKTFTHIIVSFNKIIEDAMSGMSEEGKKDPVALMAALSSSVTIAATMSLYGDLPFRMRNLFLSELATEKLSGSYDPEHARHLAELHATMPGTTFVSDVEAATLADIKKIPAEYLGPMSDAKFKELVLEHANPLARQTVDLIERFRIAAIANDNVKSEHIRQHVLQNVRKLG